MNYLEKLKRGKQSLFLLVTGAYSPPELLTVIISSILEKYTMGVVTMVRGGFNKHSHGNFPSRGFTLPTVPQNRGSGGHFRF